MLPNSGMPVKLFALNGVPDDEAEDVRALLTAGEIDYYETSAGNWGISVPAIWLHDDSQLAKARALLDEYQRQRFARARDDYRQQQREGRQRTVLDLIRENPLRFFGYLAAIAVILYFSIQPFMHIGK